MDSQYERAAHRSWIKLNAVQEQGDGDRGYHRSRERGSTLGRCCGVSGKGKLRFAGKVGTASMRPLLKSMWQRMRSCTGRPALLPIFPRSSRAMAQNITPPMKRGHWIEPELVCQVRFSEWTRMASCGSRFSWGCGEDKERAKWCGRDP